MMVMSYVAQMSSLGVIVPQRTQERYGISEESLREVRSRAGQPSPATAQKEQLTLQDSAVINKLTEAMQYQALQFERYRELTEKKFTTLSKDLLDFSMQLKEAYAFIAKIKEKHEVQVARDALQQYQQGDRAPVDKPIDRNGVAPKDVQISSIFNCAGRRY